jgi:general secretion pathway protein I
MGFASLNPSYAARECDGEAGFTLVEIIVALAILALSLSVLFFVISNGVVQTGRAEVAAEATSLAQSLLAEVGVSRPLRNGQSAGQFDTGLSWRLRMEPYVGTSDPRQLPVNAYRVSAEVFWRDGGEDKSVVLTTLRLGAKDGAQ